MRSTLLIRLCIGVAIGGIMVLLITMHKKTTSPLQSLSGGPSHVVDEGAPAGTSASGSNSNIPGVWNSVPTLELFLRMYHKHHHLYEKIFKPSLMLFWPRHIRVMVILDNESKEDHALEATIRDSPPFPKVFFEDPYPEIYNHRGPSRMQRSMFYPENYTKAEYVGYVDTDTLFVTVVTPEDLFRDGKPIVVGVIGQFLTKEWGMTTMKHYNLFGTGEVMKCMSYFPVIIKVKHVVECRHYLERLHKKSFDAIIKEISVDNLFSQFSIMCQCIYTLHRKEYIFRIQMRPNGDFKTELPGRAPLKTYKENFTTEELSPIARTSMHWKYQTVPKQELLKTPYDRETYYPQALLMGICYSGGFEMCPNHCRFFSRSVIQRDLFNFEFTDWTWHPGCMKAQERHYQDVNRLLSYYKSHGFPIFGEKNTTVACDRIYKMLQVDKKYSLITPT
ncbi:uncharacterized protein LOC106150368 [Lingula anatina]|uniref:Uncharacterized protein LOC106150368 n=1 Tax=Lingula anatina TaxID=7574 RepID=A0A1S3GY26_LINAN|nr:uncharacterized protein LOC106150368 [Lingula anatina]XP_013378567.1 uncharacterized protein LOC106150368 [Lingula anatina]XP_013378568.1 uncharacterized protein LOC106150368 [Lingula anatina]XP_013378569.1 uncharacterized protein LOC106150368 [Lingula anatina]|eukprot:XP_013378566.1 uncharacterized protein LOC106150368 [Lingula anatina]